MQHNEQINALYLEKQSFPGNEFTISCPELGKQHQEVFILQNFTNNVNDDLMELMLGLDVIRRSGNTPNINIIAPYLAYARQDQIANPRASLALKLLAKMFQLFSPKRLITIDLHNAVTAGFFDFPVTNISTATLFAQDIAKEYDLSSVVLISPDAGSIHRIRAIAKILGVEHKVMYKERKKGGVEIVFNEDVTNKQCIIIDDVIASGMTIKLASKVLVEKKAKSVAVYASHLLDFALSISSLANVDRFYTTNSIANSFLSKPSKVLDISHLILEQLQ